MGKLSMSNDIFNDIIALLEKRGPIPGESDQEKRNYHYLDSGHLDSINVIQFILQVEERFGITLTPEDTKSDQFSVVDGLIKIVENKLKG